jgi:transposase
VSIKINVMLFVIFDWKSIFHHVFVPRSQMVNKQLYQEVLERLGNAVLRKRPEMWENQTWLLHHDNAPAHASLQIRCYLANHQTSIVPHPPYFPDLATSDFFLFPKLKTTLNGHRFKSIESGKCNKRTSRHPRKCVPVSIPTMENTLETMYRQ